MSLSHAGSSNIKIDQSLQDKNEILRNNKISYTKEYLRINKNQVWYSSLSPEIKHTFISSLRQCLEKNCMKEVFHRWMDEDPAPLQGRMLFIKDQDGIQLIWRMQKAIERSKTYENSLDLTEQIQVLKKAFHSHELSYNNMIQKQKQLSKMSFSKETLSQKNLFISKMAIFKEEIEQKMRELQEQIQSKKSELKKSRHKMKLNYYAPSMSKILSKTIAKQVRNLIRQSIVAIAEVTFEIYEEGEVDQQEVYVVFEQAYQTKKIKKSTIVRVIGSEAYLEKVAKFSLIMQERRIQQKKKKKSLNNMSCCHRCLKIYPKQKLKFCRTPVKNLQTDSYPATDYYSCRKTYFEGDFFYEPKQQHIFNYFLYCKNSQGQMTCNRAFCLDCIQLLFGDKKFECPYCKGLCSCERCDKASGIVKMIALDHSNDPEQKKHYHTTLRLFGGVNHPDVCQIFPLRQDGNIFEVQTLEKLWLQHQKILKQKKVNLSFFYNLTIQRQNSSNLYLEGIFEDLNNERQHLDVHSGVERVDNRDHFQLEVFEEEQDRELPLLRSQKNIFNDQKFQDEQLKCLNKFSHIIE